MTYSELYEQALREADRANPDFAKVLILLRNAHEAQDDRATYALATSFRHGTFGLTANAREAHRLTKMLAKSNIAEALFDLAYSCDIGEFEKRDEVKAFSFYMRAALLGDQESCAQVAGFFREGTIVPRDPALAKAWRERSKLDESAISPPHRVRLR